MRESLRAEFTRTDRGVAARTISTAALELRGPFAGVLPRYFLRNVTAGMLDGDEYEVDVHVAEGAAVAVAPTSAAKVFVARGRGTSLATRIEVERDAILDYDAGLTIPHAGAVARLSTDIALHEGGRLAYTDTFAFGRLAHGERFAFERIETALTVSTPSRPAAFTRRSVLTPATQRALLEGSVAGAGVLGSLLLLGSGGPPEVADVAGAYAGASALPHGIGWQVQVLARRPEQAAAVIDAAREAWLTPSSSFSHAARSTAPTLA